MNNSKYENIVESIDLDYIIRNFDLSIVMPYYKKLNDFKNALPHNAPLFQRNGIEIVISMDDDSEEIELLQFIKDFPFINWVVAINRSKHEWRNPSKAINVGIKNATKKYVMVCSPESIFYTDAILQMRYKLEFYKNHYAIGTVAFTNNLNCNISDDMFTKPYGSIMVERKHLIDISGYAEELDKWGFDDDNIRARLELNKIKKLLMLEVKLIHVDYSIQDTKKRINTESETLKYSYASKMLIPDSITINNSNWGCDFNEIVYDWKNNKYSYELVTKYLNNFESYKIVNEKTFTQKYNRILLVQSYNEECIINEFLIHMANYFDGFILLDDGSNDATFEIADHKKLLLKVKKTRTTFNDLENRNICLDLASFLMSEWFCFMDTDERFDKRYSDFSKHIDTQKNIISFGIVHLWDKENIYNAEYPETNLGISHKLRMFRNIGHCQITTNKMKLHFLLVPYFDDIEHVDILFLHYGMLTKEDRLLKHSLYTKEDRDKDQYSYMHLLRDNAKTLLVKDIEWHNGTFINIKTTN